MILHYEDILHIYRSPSGEDRQVLDIPTWEVPEGAQVLLRGVSGSGKTTLFNITSGLLVPTKGKVYYDQQVLHELPAGARDRFRAQRVGYVFQNHLLLAPLSAIENVVMPMAFARTIPRGQWRKRAKELLAQVGLSEHFDYRPAQMSAGQRLRVGVARALANQPGLILADEPTAALDAQAADEVLDLIQQTSRERNASLLVASHDPALADRFAIIAHLEDGKLRIEEKVPA
jgi:ABC-type lipoprotein export system ATPase subunit